MREFLSTFSLRRATLELKPISNFGLISIHALLAESDLPQSAKVGVGVSFLSTLSLRRATVFILYPDSAPTFLSTLSLRRATFLPLHTRQRTQISIHALLAESDKIRQTPQRPAHHFYPRSPCGERLRRCTMPTWPLLFLSTLSLRRATARKKARTAIPSDFYPRSPCGERPHSTKKQVEYWIISIHALLAESDGFGERACRRAGISIHVLLAESDQPGLCCHYGSIFLSTLSLRRATCAKHRIPIKLRFLSTLSLRRATVPIWQ